MNKSYTELLNKFEDKENIFILGAGHSLFFNSQNSLFLKLKDYGIVICVNSAIIAETEPDYFISNDHLITFWDYWQVVLNSKCIKIVRNSWLKYKDKIKDFYIFFPRNTSEDIVDFEEKGKLCYCSSVVTALDFSIQCENTSKIFLLGVDQCLDKETQYHHFWQSLPRDKQPRELGKKVLTSWEQQKKVFKYNNMAYKALKKFAEYKNVEIYNCNKNSKVEIFLKIKFEEIEKYL